MIGEEGLVSFTPFLNRSVFWKGCFLKEKELVGKMEQSEYTKTPRGLAKQS